MDQMKTYKAKGLNAITVRDDGKAVRLQFDTTEGGVAFAMPSSAITALVPILVNAEAEAKEKTGLQLPISVFVVACRTCARICFGTYVGAAIRFTSTRRRSWSSWSSWSLS